MRHKTAYVTVWISGTQRLQHSVPVLFVDPFDTPNNDKQRLLDVAEAALNGNRNGIRAEATFTRPEDWDLGKFD